MIKHQQRTLRTAVLWMQVALNQGIFTANILKFINLTADSRIYMCSNLFLSWVEQPNSAIQWNPCCQGLWGHQRWSGLRFEKCRTGQGVSKGNMSGFHFTRNCLSMFINHTSILIPIPVIPCKWTWVFPELLVERKLFIWIPKNLWSESVAKHSSKHVASRHWCMGQNWRIT